MVIHLGGPVVPLVLAVMDLSSDGQLEQDVPDRFFLHILLRVLASRSK